MLIALLITFLFLLFVYLVFFRFKWLKFSMTWGILSAFFAVHLFLIFIIGLRFVTPYSTNVKVVQHTVQLIPRLPEPTLVTAVLVKPDTPVKKGQPLFQFDRRPYEYQVRQLEAQLDANSANITTAQYKIKQLDAELAGGETRRAHDENRRGSGHAKNSQGTKRRDLREVQVCNFWTIWPHRAPSRWKRCISGTPGWMKQQPASK